MQDPKLYIKMHLKWTIAAAPARQTILSHLPTTLMLVCDCRSGTYRARERGCGVPWIVRVPHPFGNDS
jgi:hypothetical protein